MTSTHVRRCPQYAHFTYKAPNEKCPCPLPPHPPLTPCLPLPLPLPLPRPRAVAPAEELKDFGPTLKAYQVNKSALAPSKQRTFQNRTAKDTERAQAKLAIKQERMARAKGVPLGVPWPLCI